MAKKKAMTSPTGLRAFARDEGQAVQVVIETPKGSRNKYKFDEKLGSYKLSKVLPGGMVFPYDFGFVPSTKAGDEDPIDVLLLMDEPAFPGCLIDCRLIGIIEGEQTENGETKRNDRLIAVAKESPTHEHLRELSEMSPKWTDEVGQFFVNYHRLEGREYRVLGSKGSRAAMRSLRKSTQEKAA